MSLYITAALAARFIPKRVGKSDPQSLQVACRKGQKQQVPGIPTADTHPHDLRGRSAVRRSPRLPFRSVCAEG